MTENALAVMDKATNALMKAEKLEDISTIRSHAKVFQTHAKEFKLGREAMLAACRVQLLAEVKAGVVAVRLAKDPEYKEVLKAARLTPDQVNPWRQEAMKVMDRMQEYDLSAGPEDLDKFLQEKVETYLQKIRKDPDAINVQPTFRGLLFFIDGKDSFEHQKEQRTELAKWLCSVTPFKDSEKTIARLLTDKGTSKEKKEEIKKNWQEILERGNLLDGQKPIETDGE